MQVCIYTYMCVRQRRRNTYTVYEYVLYIQYIHLSTVNGKYVMSSHCFCLHVSHCLSVSTWFKWHETGDVHHQKCLNIFLYICYVFSNAIVLCCYERLLRAEYNLAEIIQTHDLQTVGHFTGPNRNPACISMRA